MEADLPGELVEMVAVPGDDSPGVPSPTSVHSVPADAQMAPLTPLQTPGKGVSGVKELGIFKTFCQVKSCNAEMMKQPSKCLGKVVVGVGGLIFDSSKIPRS